MYQTAYFLLVIGSYFLLRTVLTPGLSLLSLRI